MKRGSGVLLSISSLPGKFGIGTFGSEAYSFIDNLKSAGQTYLQVLPLTETGPCNSPYSSVSSYAINPNFIDLDLLLEGGLLLKSEIDDFISGIDKNNEKADYKYLSVNKLKILYKAYVRGLDKFKNEFLEFKFNNSYWVVDYSMFMTIKNLQNGSPYWLWEQDLLNRHPGALMKIARENEKMIEFYQFIQYLACAQWYKIKNYANERGVNIIGDIPIYVAKDSVDVWANPQFFDKEGNVAGCPPDYYSEDGQLWGNPLYDWQELRSNSYDWWIARIAYNLSLFNYLRIDHFRAFETYYSIPKDALTAKEGHWEKGPGMEFINTLKSRLGDVQIIVEDLGDLSDNVFNFLEMCGFPGLKVLHFAFSPSRDSIYLPHNISKNCVMYTGTHDNNTTIGWFKSLPKEEKAFLFDYVGHCNSSNVCEKIIRLAFVSVADVCIIPMQDILNKDEKSRLNIPSTSKGNWEWRMNADEFDEKRISWLKKQTETFGR